MSGSTSAADAFLITALAMFIIAAVVVMYAIRRLASHPTRIAIVIIALASLVTALSTLFSTLQGTALFAETPTDPTSQISGLVRQ